MLFLFAEYSTPLSVKEISRHFSIPLSTVYRYINVLESFGLIEKSNKRGCYQLTLKVLELGEIVRRNTNYIQIALPFMKSLAAKIKESVVLAALRGNFAIWVEKIDSDHTLKVSCEPGTVQYLHAGASAKVIMAYLSEERQREILRNVGMPRLTENTASDWNNLKAQLDRIKAEGVAVSSGEVDPGVTAVASPIFKSNGEIWGSLSVVGPDHRLRGELLERAVKEVKMVAEEINAQIKRCGV